MTNLGKGTNLQAPPKVPRAPKYAPGQSPADARARVQAAKIRAQSALSEPGFVEGTLEQAPHIALAEAKAVPNVVKSTPRVVKQAARYIIAHPSKVLSTDAAVLSAGLGNADVQGRVRRAVSEGKPSELIGAPRAAVRGFAGRSAANQPFSVKGGLELAGAFPVFRGPRAIAELVKAIFAGEGVAEATRAARATYRTASVTRSALNAGRSLSPKARAAERALQESPERKALFDYIDSKEPPALAQAHKDVIDAAARKSARQRGMAPAEFFTGLHTVVHESQYVPEHALGADALAQRGNLEGLPTNVKVGGVPIQVGHNPELRQVADEYMGNAGLPHNPPTAYVARDAQEGAHVAQQYEEMLHMHDPAASPEYTAAVARSYGAFAKETLDQYHTLVAHGYTFEFYPHGVDPYPLGPRQAIQDLTQNKHLYVFPTEGGFGAGDIADHPLLADSGISWGGQPTTLNDIFRAVHDVFGHGKEGVGFRAEGEYNAFRQHAAMYSDEARPAMESETNGQNSWVNYGPHGEANQTADQASTVYAQQKAGILGHQEGQQSLFESAPVARTVEKQAPSVTLEDLQAKHSAGMPPGIPASDIAHDAINSGMNLPPELGNTHALAAAIDHVYELARAGQDGRYWYDTAAQVAKDISAHYGGKVSPEQVAQIIAIFSQAADTVANLSFVREAISQFMEHGSIYSGRFPERQSAEAEAVLRGQPWEGRKRSSFYANIIEDLNPREYKKLGFDRHPVTVDRWVTRWFTPGVDVPSQYYDVYERIIQDMAVHIGWKPKEVQAAAWVAQKKLSLAERHPTWSVDQIDRAGADAYNVGFERYFGQQTLTEGKTVSPAAKRAANMARKPDGGGTLRWNLRPDNTKTGYGAAYGAFEQLASHPIKAAIIQAFRDQHLKLLKSNPHMRVGIWHNPENSVIYLDISRHFRTKSEAMKFAQEQGQLAIWDARAGRSIPTGLSETEANAIKVRLREEHFGKSTPLPAAKSLSTTKSPAKQAYDKLLEGVAKQHGFDIKTDMRLADAERFLNDLIDRNPGKMDWAQKVQDAALAEERSPEPEAVFQRTGQGKIRGAYEPSRRTIHFSRSSGTSTIQHEFFHDLLHQSRGTPEESVFAQYAGAKRLPDGNYHWDEAAQEKFVEGMMNALKTAGKMKGPLVEAARTVAARIRADGGDVPPEFHQALGLRQPSMSETVQKATAGARSQYGKQKVMRSEELRKRAQEAEQAYQEIANPEEAHIAAKTALQGELPKIQFQGFSDLSPEALMAMRAFVNKHQNLMTFQKVRLNDALVAAVGGKVPTPSDMALIENVFGKQTATGLRAVAEQGGWHDKVLNALNIPRTIMASFDLSAPLRQGLVAGASHPILWAKSFPTMVHAAHSGKFYDDVMRDIHDDPLYNLALAANISFTDIGPESALAAHEEQFSSDYAAQALDKLHLPNFIKGSARAYTGFLNKLRMDLFKNQIRLAMAAGTDIHDEKFLHDIGRVINASTGRGGIGMRGEHIMPALNTVLFSPRLMLSRINYLNPVWYASLSKPARMEALRGLFATAGSVTSALFLFSLIPGVKVGSLDPRNPDFGKLRIGNTRLDIAGGFQQYLRLASELATNTKVSSTTGRETKLGSGFGVPTRWDEVQNFAYNKLGPVPADVVNLVRGKDTVGQPYSVGSVGGALHVAGTNFVPLIIQDSKDLYNQHQGGLDGIAWATGGYGLSMFGTGEQTYGAPNQESKLEQQFQKNAKTAGITYNLPTQVKADFPWYQKAYEAGALDEKASPKERLMSMAKVADEKRGGGTKIQDAVKAVQTNAQAKEVTSALAAYLYPYLTQYKNALASAARKAESLTPTTP